MTLSPCVPIATCTAANVCLVKTAVGKSILDFRTPLANATHNMCHVRNPASTPKPPAPAASAAAPVSAAPSILPPLDPYSLSPMRNNDNDEDFSIACSALSTNNEATLADDMAVHEACTVGSSGLFPDWTVTGFDWSCLSMQQFEMPSTDSPDPVSESSVLANVSHSAKHPTQASMTIPPAGFSVQTEDHFGLVACRGQETSIERSRGQANPIGDGYGYDVVEDFTQKLTSRLGQLRLAGDGQMRYYGVTSNLHLMGEGSFSMFNTNLRSTWVHGDAAISRNGFDWGGDEAYEQHLLDLYFAWHDPFLQEVERATFLLHKNYYKNRLETSLYSPALENAM